MPHHNTVFAQMLKLIPRHEFESLAKQHHSGRTLRKMTCWTQFVSMATAQASLRWNNGGAKWVYRHPANPFAMPAEFLAVAPFVIYGHACMDARQEQQSAQTNLMISAKKVTPMPRNVPSLMVSLCSISWISRFSSILTVSSSALTFSMSFFSSTLRVS